MSIPIAVGVGLICALLADAGLYAFGIGTMHAINGRGSMGSMTFPVWSFLAGAAGSTMTAIFMMKKKQIGFRHLVAILVIYFLGFIPLAKWWFMNPRVHDTQSQKSPGWILGETK